MEAGALSDWASEGQFVLTQFRQFVYERTGRKPADAELLKALGAVVARGWTPSNGQFLKAAGPHSFSSTQFDLEEADPHAATAVLDLADLIEDGDLAGDGREEQPYVTVLYGLHTQDPEDVRRLTEGFGPVRVQLGRTSVFPAAETDSQRGGDAYDVVKVDVASPDLVRLNRLLAGSLEHMDTHPVYRPHVTLAYVQPGLGEQYTGRDDVDGLELAFTTLVFSDPLGKRTKIDLAGRPEPVRLQWKDLDVWDEALALTGYFAKASKIGQGHRPGVPFRGPSGRWFVVRPADNRVVPTKNPNPPGKKPTARQAATATAQQAVSGVQAKIQAGTSLTPAEVAALPQHLNSLTKPQLAAVVAVLGAKVKKSAVKTAMVQALVTLAANPPAIGPIPPPIAPSVPAPLPKNVNRNDRDAIDDLVDDALKKLGKKPTAAAVGDISFQASLLATIQANTDGSVRTWEIGRSLLSLYSQQATKLIPPLYAKGAMRASNHTLPNEARPTLTTAEKVAVQVYTGTSYRLLNKDMRSTGHPPPPPPKFVKLYQDLDSAFKKSKPLPKPVTVLRGIHLDPATLAAHISGLAATKAASGTHTFNQYVSTTTNPAVNPNWPDNVIYRIQAVQGLDARPYSHCPGANELILDWDSHFTVKSVTQVGNRWHVDLEQVPRATPVQPTAQTITPAAKTPKVSKPKKIKAPPLPKPPKPANPYKRDVSEWQAVKDYLAGTKTYDVHSNRAGGSEDALLTDIMKEVGKDAKPKVLDKAGMDALKAQGWKICYRGVKDSKFTRQFRNGDLYNGAGVYGNGTYVALADPKTGDETGAKAVADRYATTYATQAKGGIMRIALPPKMKVIDESALRSQIFKYQADIDQKFQKGSLSRVDYDKLVDVSNDPGRWAAMHGYDGIKTSRADYFVLLNRSIAAVEDKDQ